MTVRVECAVECHLINYVATGILAVPAAEACLRRRSRAANLSGEAIYYLTYICNHKMIFG